MIIKGMSKQHTKTDTRVSFTAVTLLFIDTHYNFFIKIENNARRGRLNVLGFSG